MRQIARQVFTEQSVSEKQTTDQRQGDAHHPPRRLEHQDDQHDADDHIGAGQLAGALDQIGLEHPLVGEGAHTSQAQQPGQWLARPLVPPGWIAEEHQQQQETDVSGTQDLGAHRMEGSGDDLVDGEQQGDGENRLRPLAGTGVHTLTFAHGTNPLGSGLRLPAMTPPHTASSAGGHGPHRRRTPTGADQ
ncbi:hypothetical protein D9M71_572950 [compost metagenome]